MNTTPALHPITIKSRGDRVRLPKHPASRDTTYWYGTVLADGRIEWDDYNDLPDHFPMDFSLNPYDLRGHETPSYNHAILLDA